jgi:protease YdgD
MTGLFSSKFNAALTVSRKTRVTAITLLFCGAAGIATLQAEPPLRPGLGSHDPRRVMEPGMAPWRALGRVQTELGARCTGALIGPRTVLTAAHCLVAPNSGRLVQPGSVHMLLGYERGRWRAAARAVRLQVAPGFDPARRGPATADWALLHLAVPLATAPGEWLEVMRALPARGTRLMLGGYQQDRAEVLLADPDCALAGVVRGAGGVALLRHDCAGTRGASGAPLLAERAPGQWAILGINVAAFAGESAGLAVPGALLP